MLLAKVAGSRGQQAIKPPRPREKRLAWRRPRRRCGGERSCSPPARMETPSPPRKGVSAAARKPHPEGVLLRGGGAGGTRLLKCLRQSEDGTALPRLGSPAWEGLRGDSCFLRHQRGRLSPALKNGGRLGKTGDVTPLAGQVLSLPHSPASVGARSLHPALLCTLWRVCGAQVYRQPPCWWWGWELGCPRAMAPGQLVSWSPGALRLGQPPRPQTGLWGRSPRAAPGAVAATQGDRLAFPARLPGRGALSQGCFLVGGGPRLWLPPPAGLLPRSSHAAARPPAIRGSAQGPPTPPTPAQGGVATLLKGAPAPRWLDPVTLLV